MQYYAIYECLIFIRDVQVTTQEEQTYLVNQVAAEKLVAAKKASSNSCG